MTAEPELFDYEWHKHVHKGDPDTSQASAQKAGTLAQHHAAIVLGDLKIFGPSTSDEISARCGFQSIQVMKRITDLRQKGFIEDSEQRRKGDSGRFQIVWRVK